MAIKPKAPGETKVVAVMGDYWHNGVSQEIHIRRIFDSEKNWRIIFVRAGKFFTPELISDADLLITARYDGPDSIGWSPEGLVDTIEKGDDFWTDTNVKAIVDNVRTRGMGFMALHCTLFCEKKEITDLMDIEPVMHMEIQPVWVRNTNQEHPITKGIGNIFFNLDEQFTAVIKSHYTTTLFETTAMHDKRNGVGGWCLENGNGRIVCLLPGHTQWPYRVPEYQDILWRSAHWAMKKDIPPYPNADAKGDYNFHGK
jgi:type 1 glutamine amidotransferase